MNYVAVCLDETGSMHGQEERVVTSLNEYVNQLPDGAHITVFKFDSERWTNFFSDTKESWKDMTEADYNPGAMTPLYDAIGKTIKHAESLAKDGDKVMIMIDTDGYENASKEHGLLSVKSLIDGKKQAGWEFLFMASSVTDAQAQKIANVGAALGTQTHSAAYTGRRSMYAAAGAQTTSYFAGDGNNQPQPSMAVEETKETQPFFA